jgi:hypothetical protein
MRWALSRVNGTKPSHAAFRRAAALTGARRCSRMLPDVGVQKSRLDHSRSRAQPSRATARQLLEDAAR